MSPAFVRVLSRPAGEGEKARLMATRTHAKRVGRLSAAGHTEAEIARIYGPVGLNLGGRHLAEIAVSLLAEMTRVLRDVTSG